MLVALAPGIRYSLLASVGTYTHVHLPTHRHTDMHKLKIIINLKDESQAWCHMPLIPALWKGKAGRSLELQASLVYIVSSTTAKAM